MSLSLSPALRVLSVSSSLSPSLYLLLDTSLAPSSLFSIARRIYMRTRSRTHSSLLLFAPFPAFPSLSLSLCFVLSSSFLQSHTPEKYSRGSSRSSSSGGSSGSQIECERKIDRWKKSESSVERENDRRGERGRAEQVPARGGWGCRRARGSDLESEGKEGVGGAARGRENWNPE